MTAAVITYSTELMKNYKQAEVMAPDAKFEALQTAAGDALLFSIGTDGVCYLTGESRGARTGWEKTNLSGGLGTGAKASTFAVAQNRSTGAIDIALVMTGPGNDTLYLSLGNSATDTSWTKAPRWVAAPFDDAAHVPSRVVVKSVFMSEASDGEYIVVDVLRDPASAVPLIFRYYIDPTKQLTGQVWNAHDVSGDIDASAVSSCLGRRADERVDGLYTMGSIVGHSQLIYQPLYNPFRPQRPGNPVRLALPDGVVGSAMVAVASATDAADATDLFVAAGQKIYYFAADGQDDGDTGTPVLDDPIFLDVQRLFGFATGSDVILWGLNRANQVFYTRCPRGQLLARANWSQPLPICQGVEQVSPYVNRANDGNTFFVHSGVNRLQRAVQAPDTTTWKFEDILLPATPDAKSVKFSSYTTRLQVTDAAKRPLANTPVQLSALHRVGVYINGLYYVLDTTPVPVATDGVGGINIVEWVDGLRATPLRVSGADGAVVAINPMDKPFQKAANLNTADSLAAARITDKSGAARPLVPAGTSSADLDNAATALGQLADVYKTVPADGSVAPASSQGLRAGRSLRVAALVSMPVGAAQSIHPDLRVGGVLDPIKAAAGDVLSWLEGAGSYVVHIAKDAGDQVWHFIVEIAGAAYSFALDAADKVIGAVEAIYHAIKAAIEDLIAYLEFLFAWKDFVRTKDVCKKVILLGLGFIRDQADTVKQDFNGLIDDAKHKVDDWAGVKRDSWTAESANGNQPVGYLRTITDIGEALTAPAAFLYNHLVDNIQGARGQAPGKAGSLDRLLNVALTAVSNEGDVLIDAGNRIGSELIEGSQFESLSLEDMLKRLTAIIVDAFLNTGEVIVDTLIDLFNAVLSVAIDALDTPIWIPVVSDILEDVFDVKISFSLLDVIMMVGAIPATLVYKAAKGTAPFSSGDGFSDKILAAPDLASLAASFASAGPQRILAETRPQTMLMVPSVAAGAPKSGLLHWLGVDLGDAGNRTVYIVGHVVAGIGAFLSAVVTVPALTKDGPETQDYARAITVCGAVSGFATFLAGVFQSPNPIANAPMAQMASATALIAFAGRVGFGVGPYIQGGGSPSAEIADAWKKVGTSFDALMAVLQLVPTCYHMYEQSKAPASPQRTEAYLDASAAICNDLSRIAALGVVWTKDPRVKLVFAGAMAVLIVLYGGLEVAETITEAASG